MESNVTCPAGRVWTHVEFPEHFVWKDSHWEPCKQGECIGRIYFVAPRSGEKYYLRVLLHHVRGAKSWEDIRTVGNQVCATFKEACVLRGLLQDDREWHACMQ